MVNWPGGAGQGMQGNVYNCNWSVTMVSPCVTVSLGTVPSSDALKGLPTIEAGEEVGIH